MGDYSQIVALQRAQRLEDDQGGYTEQYVEHTRTYARIEPMSAAHRHFAGQSVGEATHQVWLRDRRVDVREKDRCLVMPADEGQKGWDVVAVMRDQHGLTQLLCREGGPSGQHNG